MVRNPQATCSSVVMAVLKGSGFCMVAHYREITKLIEQAAMPVPRLEELGLMLEGGGGVLHAWHDSGALPETAARIGAGTVHHGHRGGVYTPMTVSQGSPKRYSAIPADHDPLTDVLYGFIGRTCLRGGE